ncbi:MAG TPA: hypothetical protein VJ729_09565 [Nitrososphaeraceae archaeon]|nr:hypothetical protein [Nitrososphaeraceae archaeon]
MIQKIKNIRSLPANIRAALIVMAIFTAVLSAAFCFSAVYAQGNNDSGTIITRGGGSGSITCPDGSSKPAVIAFVALGNSSKGQINTSWNINELPSGQDPVPGFASGSFNSVNVSSDNFKVTGQKINEAHFCEPPLSLPVTISGLCGENVAIKVRFQSNNPFLITGGTFTGDVTCSHAAGAER